MKRNKGKDITRNMKGSKKVGPDHTRNDVGLPQDIKVVHSGEPNPNDGQ